MTIATTVDIIDFHNHHVPARFELTAGKTAPASQRSRWEALARKLSDQDLLLKGIREGDLRARVVNIPAQLIESLRPGTAQTPNPRGNFIPGTFRVLIFGM
jgi:hypothetical protein